MMAAIQREASPPHDTVGAATLLLREAAFRDGGGSPILTLAERRGRVLLLTLGITHVIDRQSLGVSIWGSADGVNWDSDPLLTLPRKYYCGSYEKLLDLLNRPDVHYLRATWTMNRWAQDDRKPLFEFCISIRELGRTDDIPVSPADSRPRD
jgi:hypothetical protein